MRKRIYNEATSTPWHEGRTTCQHFNIGYSTLIKWARECGAVVKIGRINRFNWDILDADLHRRMEKAM